MKITDLVIAFFITLISTLLLVIPVKEIAIKFNFLDNPNGRKIHKRATPRIGGVAIFLGTACGLLYLQVNHAKLFSMVLGATVIVLVGMIDDKFQIRPLLKLMGQIIATTIVITDGIIIERITLPILGLIEFNMFISIVITFIWFIGITNAINLIDGLDGLASGVSTIGLASILVMAVFDGDHLVIVLSALLIAGNLGFLFHNFYPAKIYMGDTGSMLLGYSIAVLSTIGLFKNVTLFSFIVPIIILAIPIFDMIFVMVRRFIDGKNILIADNRHIHYRLLEAGYSHRTTVLIIYGFSALFGFIAILFSKVSVTITLILTMVLFLLLQSLTEILGIVGNRKQLLFKQTNDNTKNN